MAKIRGDFYTKREAAEAMDKISRYCVNAKISEYNYGGSDAASSSRDKDFYGRYSFGVPGFMGLPLTGAFSLGGLASDWASFPGYGIDTYDSYESYDVPVSEAVLEADVQDGNYNLVKEKLYSCGAVSVY